MQNLISKLPNVLRKYEQFVLGLLVGATLFLVFTLSALNIILFLTLGNFVMLLILYVGLIIKPGPQAKQSIAQAIKEAHKGRGRPKGAKNKPKPMNEPEEPRGILQ